jgi:hypothetical protein
MRKVGTKLNPVDTSVVTADLRHLQLDGFYLSIVVRYDMPYILCFLTTNTNRYQRLVDKLNQFDSASEIPLKVLCDFELQHRCIRYYTTIGNYDSIIEFITERLCE